MNKTLYLKAEQCIETKKTSVTIADVAKMECSEPSIVNRLKTEKLFSMDDKKNSRRIVSMLYVIQKIHEVYPELEVQNLGEADFVISYHPKKQPALMEKLKVAFVCSISFFGSMFAMMTFNEDVSTHESFFKVYEWVMGYPPSGVTVLEITYSIGVSAGIIIFFNHIGKKYLTDDPSPVEVEMAGYEQQVNQSLIKQVGRRGKEKDVD